MAASERSQHDPALARANSALASTIMPVAAHGDLGRAAMAAALGLRASSAADWQAVGEGGWAEAGGGLGAAGGAGAAELARHKRRVA